MYVSILSVFVFPNKICSKKIFAPKKNFGGLRLGELCKAF